MDFFLYKDDKMVAAKFQCGIIWIKKQNDENV